MNFNLSRFSKIARLEETLFARLQTGKKILSIFNILCLLALLGCLFFCGVLNRANLFSLPNLVLLSATAVIAVDTLYFFYAWSLHRRRASLVQCEDALTGLWNWTYFSGLLQEEIMRSGRYRFPTTLCLLDLDHFKSLNQNFGRERADQLLKRFASFLKAHTRATDLLSRYQNDSFFLLFPHTDVVKAQRVVDRLWHKSTEELDISFRAGITPYYAGEKAAQFQLRAIAALEKAKKTSDKRIICLIGQEEGQAVLEF